MTLDKIVFFLAIITIGYAICFYGYKLRNLVLVFIWFLLGFTLSNEVFKNVFTQVDMLHAFSTIIGLLCSLFSYKLHLLNIFVCVSWMIGNILYYELTFEQNVNFIIAIVIGIIAGLIAVKFEKILLIITTSIIGSSIMIKSSNFLPISIDKLILVAIQIFIIILGLIYQYKTCKNIKKIEIIEVTA